MGILGRERYEVYAQIALIADTTISGNSKFVSRLIVIFFVLFPLSVLLIL